MVLDLSDWQPLAWTGELFADFQPYVPAVDDAGSVVFQAALRGGGSGVFLARDGRIEALLGAEPGESVISHPDCNARGDMCAYLARDDGSSALVAVKAGQRITLADSRDGVFAAIGPLGPVMDAAGSVAFRATLANGSAAVCAWSRGVLRVLAHTGDGFSGFHGLPVIAGAAGVVFRADRSDGVQGVYRGLEGAVIPVVERVAGDGLLAMFPTLNAQTEAACGWVDAAGEGHLLRVADGREALAVDAGFLRFESLRGCLLGDDGELCFTGTPRGGRLGVYRVMREGVMCLLEEGVAMAGARVQGFALNPVSIGASGRIAARMLLDDGRQVIASLG